MAEFALVLTSAGSDAEAEAIADALLAEGLAACVQLSAIRSRYVWKGAVERADEVLVSIKTRAALFEAVRARVRELHSYETPEVVLLPIEAGDADYLAWMAQSLRG